ncbi:MAG: sigma-54 dependent transcriptional regulator [Melioribacteraceae bacterium]|nr:sigma-54 dependent transcriptional regulator [Melioribacteraceae bacterium]MCF8264126.1 sigma-54 dependent transcriptional regulator [Melioribacteraceae bacterium]
MNKKNGRILIVDDNEDVLFASKLLLKNNFGLIHTETNPSAIPNLLLNESYDVILLDMNFTQDMTSGQEGFYWLKEILKIEPTAVVILITAFGDVDTAVKAMKEGATDFVLKPWQNEKFLATISAAVKLSESRKEVNYLRSRQQQLTNDIDLKFHDLVGQSNKMQMVFNLIEKVARTDANVLITGENGTGKELVARALHRRSNRKDDIFIGVDLGAISKSLFESELFGHVKGSFTDAKESRAGRFELASNGTLFLDEISNIPLELQAKLLSAIQSRQINRVGSAKIIDVDIRLICATNSNLEKLVTERSFRQDLLYRIKTVEIEIPPLRERGDDIKLLSEHFLNTFKKKYYKPELVLGNETIDKLKKYEWPGNVRELQHAIERAVILSDDLSLQPGDFPLGNKENDGIGLHFSNMNLEEIEKITIMKALEENDGNISKAAKKLGLTRTSLYRRMEKYNL